MKKSGIVFVLVSLLLAAAAMLLRKLELLTVLDAGGLAVFRPVTAVLIALSVLTAVFYFLFARRTAASAEPVSFGAFRGLGIPGIVWGAVCLAVQLLGAWLLYKNWKSAGGTLELILAILAGLAGAGWLYLRIEEYRSRGSAGQRLLAGSLVTLFYCFWLIVYYRYEAVEPSLVLTVYAFLALCACAVAGYSYTGGSVERLKLRRTLFFCGLALYLSLVAMVRQEAAAFRLFWLVAALQFCQSGLVLLTPGDPVKTPEPAEEGETGEAEAPEGEPGPAEEEAPSAPEGEEG